MKTCYPDEAFFLLLPDSFSLSPVRQLRHLTFSLQVQKSPVPCFPKGRGIRSCYHLMFPKRSHAPAHGVLIIKDPGISNGCQFRHSLLAFRRNIRFPLSVCSSGMYSEKEVRAPLIYRQLSVRSRSFPYLFPSSLFHYIPHALTRLYGSLYGDSGALSRAEALKFVNCISFPAISP